MAKQSQIRYCVDDCGSWGKYRYSCPYAHGVDLLHIKKCSRMSVPDYEELIDRKVIVIGVQCNAVYDWRDANLSTEIKYEKPSDYDG